MVRYAIMGTNWLSRLYLDAIRAEGNEVVAICSRNPARAKELGGDQIQIYTDLDDMLRNPGIDAVYLCIPNVLHANAAIRCLNAGKHVLCEKPATISSSEMKAVIAAAAENERVFAEAIMNFYSPAMDQLREELKGSRVVSARLDYSQRSSKLDQVRAGEKFSSFERNMFGGALTDLGCYVLHFAVNLFGEPRSLTASATFLGEVDGTVSLVLHYNGFDVSVSASKCGHSMIGSEIQCDHATYTMKNLSVVLGVEKHSLASCEEFDCGISCDKWPVANPAVLPGVQARVIRAFDRWVACENLAENQRLLQESLAVQKLIEEAHRQIGY